MKSFWPWQPLLLATVFVFGIIIGGTLDIYSPNTLVGNSKSEKSWVRSKSDHYKLVEALRFIDAQYISDVSSDKLMDIALHAVFDSLDPHSFYISQEEFQDINERTRGDFEGIGVEYLRIEDTVVVVRVLENGPAKKAGLRSGDKIIQADGIDLSKIPSTDSIKRLIKGPAGSAITLKVLHPYRSDPSTYQVQRNTIPYHSVTYSGKIDSNIAYIKLSHFNGNAYQEFMESLEDLAFDYKIEKLIIDVRDNPGGYLSEVVKILSQLFTENGRLLVYTENGKGVQKEFKSTGKNFYTIEDIAVLVNSNSASASEILAGALQDWERGIVFGQRTYGKGLVQEQFNLMDGSAIRLTTAKYLTPSGRMIQRPYKNRDYSNSNAKRLEIGEFFTPDSIEVIDSTSFKTQLGSPLVSGEGIIPDEFIPLDSSLFSDCYMWSSTYYQQFIYEYIYERGEIKSELRIPHLMSEWTKFLRNQEEFSNHCTDLSPIQKHFERYLIYFFHLYTNDIESAYSANISRDESIEFILNYWR